MSAAEPENRFAGFLRWLKNADTHVGAAPQRAPGALMTRAMATWQAYRGVQQDREQEVLARIRGGGYFEKVELLAAADLNEDRWLPRLRTPNGFVLSPLYASDAAGAVAVGVLVECPDNLAAELKGQPVQVLCAGQWIALGPFDLDGKVSGELPRGIDFAPPLGLRVGGLEDAPRGGQPPDSAR